MSRISGYFAVRYQPMETTFLIIVGVLIILAATDLIVGVSNDAVNFLNSAIGAKVASRKVIMAVAAAGIFIGATFSSGMMEIARKGIFNPELFMFTDIMMIFLAVMLADIILLDLFNSLGLPTSTTVSIVFELLGAAVVLAFMKTIDAGQPLEEVSNYINSSKALAIITGILLSVFIAFTIGALVQLISRNLFSFEYQRRLKYFGSVWTGLAMTAFTYFLLLKGLKGSSFVTEEFLNFISRNSWQILLASFALWTLALQIALSVFKANILRFVVLFGTFSLAMAFAGNDLVNFVGVPLAGLESFLFWKNSGVAPDQLSMEMLSNPVRANTFFLLGAGLIMALTLYLSKKARRVTDTQVNLSRQDEQDEQFEPNFLARWLVRIASVMANMLAKSTPRSWKLRFAKNFDNGNSTNQPDGPAFDLIRAAVNLTVASALIALGTSYKLPLSTTYVSFMVAMGSSLTDKAWGRESAVYRVAGVLNVIGGWFATALVAFLLAGTFVLVMYLFGFNAGFALMMVVTILIIRGFIKFKKKDKLERQQLERHKNMLNRLNEEVFVKDVLKSIQLSSNAYAEAINGVITEDTAYFKKGYSDVEELSNDFKTAEKGLFQLIRNSTPNQLDSRGALLEIFGKMQDIFQSSEDVLLICRQHILNNHKPPSSEQMVFFKAMVGAVKNLTQKSAELENTDEEARKLDEILDQCLKSQFKGIQKGQYGKKNSSLVFRLISETRDYRSSALKLSELLRELGRNSE